MSDTRHSVVPNTAKDPAAANSASRGFFAPLRMTRTWRASLLALRSLGKTGPARIVSVLIRVYQLTVSPALAALNPACGCRFAPTCSHYAREALREHGVVVGLLFTLRRLVKCGPWHPGGADPVPRRRSPVCTKVSAA